LGEGNNSWYNSKTDIEKQWLKANSTSLPVILSYITEDSKLYLVAHPECFHGNLLESIKRAE